MVLDGLKTYILGASIVGLSALYAFNLIDLLMFEKVLGILVGLGLITLRAGVSRA